jgi:hypothetical protein
MVVDEVPSGLKKSEKLNPVAKKTRINESKQKTRKDEAGN